MGFVHSFSCHKGIFVYHRHIFLLEELSKKQLQLLICWLISPGPDCLLALSVDHYLYKYRSFLVTNIGKAVEGNH